MSKNGQSIRVLVADGSAFMRNRLSMMLRNIQTCKPWEPPHE
jgi:hypothetical protein